MVDSIYRELTGFDILVDRIDKTDRIFMADMVNRIYMIDTSIVDEIEGFSTIDRG